MFDDFTDSEADELEVPLHRRSGSRRWNNHHRRPPSPPPSYFHYHPPSPPRSAPQYHRRPPSPPPAMFDDFSDSDSDEFEVSQRRSSGSRRWSTRHRRPPSPPPLCHRYLSSEHYRSSSPPQYYHTHHHNQPNMPHRYHRHHHQSNRKPQKHHNSHLDSHTNRYPFDHDHEYSHYQQTINPQNNPTNLNYYESQDQIYHTQCTQQREIKSRRSMATDLKTQSPCIQDQQYIEILNVNNQFISQTHKPIDTILTNLPKHIDLRWRSSESRSPPSVLLHGDPNHLVERVSGCVPMAVGLSSPEFTIEEPPLTVNSIGCSTRVIASDLTSQFLPLPPSYTDPHTSVLNFVENPRRRREEHFDIGARTSSVMVTPDPKSTMAMSSTTVKISADCTSLLREVEWKSEELSLNDWPRGEDMPKFDGKCEIIDDFLDWLVVVDDYLDSLNLAEDKQVRLVVSKLRGRAQARWSRIVHQRKLEHKDPVLNWPAMRQLLCEQFFSTPFDPILFQQYRNCVQGDRSIVEYSVEFQNLVMGLEIEELEIQRVLRFLGGLRKEIKDGISLLSVANLSEAICLAIRVGAELVQAINKGISTIGAGLLHELVEDYLDVVEATVESKSDIVGCVAKIVDFEDEAPKRSKHRLRRIASSLSLLRWSITLFPLWLWDERRRDFSVGVFHTPHALSYHNFIELLVTLLTSLAFVDLFTYRAVHLYVRRTEDGSFDTRVESDVGH